MRLTAIGTRLIILPALLLACLIGLALGSLWPLAGAALLVGGLGALWVLSLAPVADALLAPLERAFRPLVEPAEVDGKEMLIAVLGAGFSKDRRLRGLGRLSPTAHVRLAEGVRLLHGLAGARLLVCNYPETPAEPVAEGAHGADQIGRVHAMREAALELGVDPARLVALDAGGSTRAELAALTAHVGPRPVLLVTSAAHMPRAMRLARRLGLACRAAPTDFRAHPADATWILRWLPSTHELAKSERAIYEHLAAARFGG